MIHKPDDFLPDPEAPQVQLGTAVRALARLLVTKDVDGSTALDVTTLVAQAVERLEKVGDRPPASGNDVAGLRQNAGLFNPVIGLANPMAPPMQLTVLDDGTATLTGSLDRRCEGPPGAVHGGWVAFLLDQTLGHAAAALGVRAFTAELTVRYLKPTPFDTPLVVAAKAEQPLGRTLRASATLSAGALVTVTAEGTFIAWPAQGQDPDTPPVERSGAQ